MLELEVESSILTENEAANLQNQEWEKFYEYIDVQNVGQIKKIISTLVL